MQLSEFLQAKHTCVISTEIKRQNMTSTPGIPFYALFWFLFFILSVTAILTSNSADEFYLFSTLCNWNCAVYTLVSGLFYLNAVV